MFFIFCIIFTNKNGAIEEVGYFLTPKTALLNTHLVITFKLNLQLKMKTFLH